MDYRKFKDTIYVRMDRGDEVVSGILNICEKENISSAVFSGIGGCSEAQIQTFNPETGTFDTRTIRGMLELVSLSGDVVSDGRELFSHTHAMFTFKEGGQHCFAGGHIRSITVLYTAEIELRPVAGGTIGRQYDPETGTGFWSFQ